jgi:hypothetical protein
MAITLDPARHRNGNPNGNDSFLPTSRDLEIRIPWAQQLRETASSRCDIAIPGNS